MPETEIHIFEPGEHVVAEPGSIFLTSGPKAISRLIQLSQSLRHPQRYAKWNHAGVVLRGGSTLESLWHGPEEGDLDNYTDSYVAVISPDYHPHDRAQILAFCDEVLDHRFRYNYIMIASLLVSLLTGTRFGLTHSTSVICSALVADALRPAGYVWPKASAWMMSGDLAQFFGVEFPPEP